MYCTCALGPRAMVDGVGILIRILRGVNLVLPQGHRSQDWWYSKVDHLVHQQGSPKITCVTSFGAWRKSIKFRENWMRHNVRCMCGPRMVSTSILITASMMNVRCLLVQRSTYIVCDGTDPVTPICHHNIEAGPPPVHVSTTLLTH